MKNPPSSQGHTSHPPKGPTVPSATTPHGRHRRASKIRPGKPELPQPASKRLAWLGLKLADRCLRIGSVVALLFGIVAACYLTLRRSSDLSTIAWLPHWLDPVIRWTDYHGYLRNVPAYALLALPVMVLYRDQPARAGMMALLAVLAAVLECLQLFIPTRYFGLADIALSWVGLAATWGLAEGIHWGSHRLRRYLSLAKTPRSS